MTGGGFIQVHSRAGSLCTEAVPATRSFITKVQQPSKHKKEIQSPKEFLSLTWHIEPHSEYQKSLVQKSYTTEHKNPAVPAL